MTSGFPYSSCIVIERVWLHKATSIAEATSVSTDSVFKSKEDTLIAQLKVIN